MEISRSECRRHFKNRCRQFDRGLISFDDLCGYMQAMHDMNVLTNEEVLNVLVCAIHGKIIDFNEED